MIKIKNILIGKGNPLAIISGPCVIENFEITFEIAQFLKNLTTELELPFIFKASFDKANRSSISSYRGPGIIEGLKILKSIKDILNIPIISDVHRISEIDPASEVLDVIQIPAFLCRQTDILVAAGQTKKPINIKKGQFIAPWDVTNIIDKVTSTGNKNIVITERGSMFGYNNLVVDFRSINIIQNIGYPVIFDATHSVQLPGGQGTCSGGQREFAPILAQAAVAAGADGIFMEVHTDPDKALCDGPNSLKLDELKSILKKLKAIKSVVSN
ncbi:MAG: 3-deoxy-8-phosphooctulonate synthase [Desulfobacterales bacterium]|nr:3-deoxy-8-phosphooctulonate synthase [Desulfobacterales bacterium]